MIAFIKAWLRILFGHRRIIADLRHRMLEQRAKAERLEGTVAHLNSVIDDMKRRTSVDVGNNGQIASMLKLYEVLIQKQQVALNEAGLGKYALPPIACLPSVYPELFPPRHSKQSKDNSAPQQSLTGSVELTVKQYRHE